MDKNSKAQIVATIGPASDKYEILKSLIEHQVDVIRFNFSWSDNSEREKQIALVRQVSKDCNRVIPIIADLPGPRIQQDSTHSYDHESISAITEKDKEYIKFAVEQSFEYIAVSFVGSAKDINDCRDVILQCGGKQKIIAKIERAMALENLDSIVNSADAIMVARGDLGSEIPLEQIPFVQSRIINSAIKAKKPVIVATQMMLSMVKNNVPTRAEVTDVANAILQGSDAVMLSEETSIGAYPLEVIIMMEKIIKESEKHINKTKEYILF